MELNDNASELKESIGEVLITNHARNVPPGHAQRATPLAALIRSGGQYFENLCNDANLRLR